MIQCSRNRRILQFESKAELDLTELLIESIFTPQMRLSIPYIPSRANPRGLDLRTHRAIDPKPAISVSTFAPAAGSPKAHAEAAPAKGDLSAWRQIIGALQAINK